MPDPEVIPENIVAVFAGNFYTDPGRGNFYWNPGRTKLDCKAIHKKILTRIKDEDRF